MFMTEGLYRWCSPFLFQ